MSVVNFQFNIQLNLSDHIGFIIQEIIRNEFLSDLDSIMTLISISCFAQTDFKKVDEKFKNFGTNLLKLINLKFELEDFGRDVIVDSFSKLLMNNLDFSNCELFPNIDIQKIKSKLQVELLLDGGNFNLVPETLKKCSNVQFFFS
jgi:hypothetical protein